MVADDAKEIAADEGKVSESTDISGGQNEEGGSAVSPPSEVAEGNHTNESEDNDNINEKKGNEETNTTTNNNNSGETAISSESYFSDNEDWTDYDDGDEASYDPREVTEMPLLKYGRIVGSLPRISSSDTTAATNQNKSRTADEAGADAGAGLGTASTGGAASGTNDADRDGTATTTADPTQPPSPSPLAVPLTCQCMGRVVLGPGARVYSSDAAPAVAASQAHQAGGGGGLPNAPTAAAADRARTSSSSKTAGADDVTAKIRHVLALGFADGTVRVVDPITGADIVPLGKLTVPGTGIGDLLNRGAPTGTPGVGGGNNGVDTSKSIVAVSFDASGTFLAAINANGDAAVFELKYIAGDVRATAAAAAAGAAAAGADGAAAPATKEDHIANLLSAWTQQPQRQAQAAVAETTPQPTAAAAAAAADAGAVDEAEPLLQNLTVTLPIPTSRFAYPRSTHSIPTCLSIDPTYRRRREKSVLVGFADGRLILTKRGMLFSRRSDSVIYQGVGGPSKSGTVGGIEAVTWRGSLVAWADASGIKLFDIDDMIRIAHVDRPTGARASLYPSISALRPTLLFERPNSLLIAWGDCIMSMLIKERAGRTGAAAESGAEGSTGAPGSPKVTKRRTVECSVAWELDCVSCGAVPLDGKHWAVLGLVPKPAVDDNDEGNDDQKALFHTDLPTSNAGNLVELQIISRLAGTVVAADALPLVKLPLESPSTSASDAGLDFSLISSYCTSRMDVVLEVEEEELNGSVEDHAAEVAMFDAMSGGSWSEDGAGSAQQHRFLDPHLKWSVDSVRFTVHVNDSSDIKEKEQDEKEIIDGGGIEDDALSVYSDDYTFLFRPEHVSSGTTSGRSKPRLPVEPPTMIIASSRDLVLARTRDIDDAVAHARSAGKHGQALQIALEDTRMVRRHSLNRLIDEYLSSVLRLKFPSTVLSDSSAEEEGRPSLTVSRLRLAAKATPRLLGGHVEMWRKWIKEFALIPGGLFVLREYLPVRDPKLPPKVYEMVLAQMLSELEVMLEKNDSDDKSSILDQDAADLFLKTLRAWGPTSSISERIKVHRMFTTRQVWHERGAVTTPEIEEAKGDLYNRRHQTVVGYLQTSAASSAQVGAAKHSLDKALDGASSSVSSSDSLFSIENVRQLLDDKWRQALNVDDGEEGNRGRQTIAATALEAVAELDFMKGNHKESLKLLLAVGAEFSTVALADIESEAIRSVNATSDDSNSTKDTASNKVAESQISYHHILGVIEYHHLHWCLLDTQFLSFDGNGMDKSSKDPQSPILALIRLVGLGLSGPFLVDHCSLPRSTNSNRRQSNTHRSQTLPIDLVANQLRATPKLLHWYLTQVFLHKPEVYVKFPNTAVPPRAITDLHRTHLELQIKYAVDTADKGRKLSEIPSYDNVDAETPLLAFLKAALPHGGTRPDDIRRMLEVCREGRTHSVSAGPSGPIGRVKHPHLFARELAYVIEHCGSGTEEDAKIILQLYLEGAKSLPLAVGYTQRNAAYSTLLWESLISYCLNPKPQLSRTRQKGRKDSIDKEDGSLFGALLEVAARSGADLAHLVSEIPTGMKIEGLRPRLVAAISDYRIKLQMHEAAANVLNKDKVALIRELSHTSRRGVQFAPLIEEDTVDSLSSNVIGAASSSGPSTSETATITEKSKGDASSLVEEKGVRLFLQPQRIGVIRSKSLAIR